MFTMTTSMSDSRILLGPSEVTIETSTGTKEKSLNKGRELKKSKSSLEDKGTVLLRQPLPKYSFNLTNKPNKEKRDEVKHSQPVANVVPSVREDSSGIESRKVFKVSPLKADTKDIPKSVQEDNVPRNNSPTDKSHRGKTHSLHVSVSSPNVTENSVSLNEEIKCLKQENESLKNQLDVQVSNLKKQLDVQIQVNTELKRLLVASVGDDLHFRMEHLVRDKAQLSKELGDFSKKLTDDYEHMDKISIQADMWRSKFLASRVMIDELAGDKAYFAMQCQESQNAMQQMLNERHELRRNLFETYRCLEQIKSAFDPLSSKKTVKPPSTNALDLARMNQRLTENIKYRLLPRDAVRQIDMNPNNWEDNMTLAESYAHELLSKGGDPELYQRVVTPSVVDRYHPYAKFDNLTLNCCEKCQGELTAV